MEAAVATYSKEQEKPEVERRGLHPIAKDHGVSFKTLSRRFRNEQSIAQFNTTKQRLTLAEEKVIVDFTIASADCGIPLSHQMVTNAANEILRA
ncbi:hypothetical protein BU15DRAFT_50282 [Melanogaster broomeanus]|nr:hypothetical protein BU15DRAFT_50282 [Melanogaster broomeanus]